MSSLSGSVVGTIVNNLAYNAMDLPVQADLSNAVADLYLRYRYHALDYGSDSWPYGGLWDIRLMRGDFTNLLRLEHKYDYVGNVARIVETPNTQDYTYEYDDLDRLLKRKITGGADQETFGYNQIGNLMSKSGVNYSYGAKPHAATAAGSQTYEYDGNGNMTRRGSQYLKYDAENRVVKVSTDISGTQHVARFAYDGDGKRAKRVDDNGTIHYVGGHHGRNVGNAPAPQVVFPPQKGNIYHRESIIIGGWKARASSLCRAKSVESKITTRALPNKANLVATVGHRSFRAADPARYGTPATREAHLATVSSNRRACPAYLCASGPASFAPCIPPAYAPQARPIFSWPWNLSPAVAYCQTKPIAAHAIARAAH